MADTTLNFYAGILRSNSWQMRESILRECRLQLARWHMADKEMDVETAYRILGSRHLPERIMRDVISALPPAPSTHRAAQAVRILKRRVESYNKSCVCLLVIRLETEVEELLINSRKKIVSFKGLTDKPEYSIPRGRTFIQLIMRQPYKHIYEEHYIDR